jgi:mRNA interferase RelE/StbE
MPVSALKVPAEVRNLIRQLHPDLKRKIRSALADILEDPTCEKALREALHGYWSLRVGRIRIIYRSAKDAIEIVAIGPRDTIYEDAARQILRDQKKP